MQALFKFGLVFLGGVVLGSMAKKGMAGAGIAGFRPAATDLLSRGLDVKECVMSKVEILKETVEDLVAEAQSASEQRKMEQEQELKEKK